MGLVYTVHALRLLSYRFSERGGILSKDKLYIIYWSARHTQFNYKRSQVQSVLYIPVGSNSLFPR